MLYLNSPVLSQAFAWSTLRAHGVRYTHRTRRAVNTVLSHLSAPSALGLMCALPQRGGLTCLVTKPSSARISRYLDLEYEARHI